MSTRNYNDWTIKVLTTDSSAFYGGKGFIAYAYIEKQDGTKKESRVFGDYSGKIKTHKQMFEQVIKYLSVL